MTQHKICIFGGSGFVGTRLALALARAGHDLRVPTRSLPRGRHLLVLPGVELVEADPHDEAQLPEVLEGCDAAVNLIGTLAARGRHGEGFRHVHTELAGKIVRACRRQGIGRLLHMSALKANAERGPSHYLRTKGEAENLIRAEDIRELAWTIFQPAPMFGTRDSFINRFAGLVRFLPALPLARAQARLAPVHVEDVVRVMAMCLEDRRTAGETYQLCGPNVYTLREIVEFIVRTQNRRRLVVGLPDFLGRIQARTMEFVPGKLFSLDNFLSLTVNNVCTENGFDKLGIRPRSMETVVPRYLRR